MAHLGKWQLVAEIARGGMGIVYLAIPRDEDPFGKLYVLKQLRPELASGTEPFLEEAKQAARLVHPNIVAIHDVGVDEKRPFAVMDYLEGVTLARVLRKKVLKLGAQLRVICEALSGLHYAHAGRKDDDDPLGDLDGSAAEENGPRSMPRVVVHRAPTPQNIFITYAGDVVLVDFGVSRAFEKPRPHYLAPEQISDSTVVDARTDVFAVGIMLWEAVAGERMWAKKTDDEIRAALTAGEIPALTAEAPAQIVRIVEKALMKSPEDRYASAANLRIDLEGFLMSSGTNATTGDVVALVRAAFDAERKTIKETINEQLSRVAQRRDSAKIPSLPPPSTDPIEQITPRPSPSLLKQADPASIAPPAPTPTTPKAAPTPRAAAVRKRRSPVPPPPEKKSRAASIIIVMLVIGLLLAGCAFVMMRMQL